MAKPGTLFIVSAPSGAGKTSLVLKAIDRLADVAIARVITYTTKKPRNGERNGIDYHFIDEGEFKQKIAQDFFLEYSTAYGYYYGTPCSIIDELASGRSYILIIDRAGAQQIVSKISDAVCIWIGVQDLETLKQRLHNRSGQSEQEVQRRLAIAADEIAWQQQNDLYKHIVQNTVFDQALNQLCTIIQGKIAENSGKKVTNNIKIQTFEI